jgi:ATP/ADP translocase
MAKKVKKRQLKQTKKVRVSPFNIYWEKKNYHFLALGIVVVIIGFYLMSVGAWNSFSSLIIAPILLVVGYVLIFPLSIFYRKKDKKKLTQDSNVANGKS